jgi:hypothetical protein
VSAVCLFNASVFDVASAKLIIFYPFKDKLPVGADIALNTTDCK